MLSKVEDFTCEKFEANIFNKNRCQNCLRTLSFHQHGNQNVLHHAKTEELSPQLESFETASETGVVEYWKNDRQEDAYRDESSFCILAPECELYFCTDSEDITESYLKRLVYSNPSETNICNWTHKEESSVLRLQQVEMTRLSAIGPGSGRRGSLHGSALWDEDTRGRGTRSPSPTWGQSALSESRGRTTSFSSKNSSFREDTSITDEGRHEAWRKNRVESGYFSLERSKSEPDRSSSPHRRSSEASGATLRSRSPLRNESSSNNLMSSGRLTSSMSSLDSETSADLQKGQGRLRRDYTILADLPKPKRISSMETCEQEKRYLGMRIRMRSPGREEVERIFGHERRRPEIVDAFQALESGMIERLDGRLFGITEKKITRRQSSPSLYSEDAKMTREEYMSWRDSLRSTAKPRKDDEKPSRQSESDWRDMQLRPSKSEKGNAKSVSQSDTERRNTYLRTSSTYERDDKSFTKQLENDWRNRDSYLHQLSKSDKERGKATRQPERDWRSEEVYLRPTSKSETRELKGIKQPDTDWRNEEIYLRPGSRNEKVDEKLSKHSDMAKQKRESHLSQLQSSRHEKMNTKQTDPGQLRSKDQYQKPSKMYDKAGLKSPEPGYSRSKDQYIRPTERYEKTDLKSLVPRNKDQYLRPNERYDKIDLKPQEPNYSRSKDQYLKPSERHDKTDSKPQEPNYSRSKDPYLRPSERYDKLNSKPQEPNYSRIKDQYLRPSERHDKTDLKPVEPSYSRNKDQYLRPSEQFKEEPKKTRHLEHSRSRSPSPERQVKQQKPDLLNFKKGWMSLLDERGEWKKHWFVLTDSSLRYYRDSNAEEADDLDGEIDLISCSDVTEYQVQRNYGFQINTREGVFTLSAMTSGIRRNWIEALKKNVRPATAPDVTKLSDSNKENAFRDAQSRKSSARVEEERPVSDIIMRSNSNRRTESHNPRPMTFDYVELEPIQPVHVSQEHSQRVKSSRLHSESQLESGHWEEVEREQAQKTEEKRRWFEGSGSGSNSSSGLHREDLINEVLRKGSERTLQAPALTEEQRHKITEEIEKKWQELERLPLRDQKQVQLPLTFSSRTGSLGGESTDALEKDLHSLKTQLERAKKDLESFRRRNEQLESQQKSREDGVPKGYVSQATCERSIAQMQETHQQAMLELQRHHKWELERLTQEKDQLLAEETAATLAAIESLKKAHREELQKELQKALRLQNDGNGVNLDSARRQHKSEMEALQRELQVLSEQYSQRCLEVSSLARDADQRERLLSQCQEEGKRLLKENQELSRRLSQEINRLQTLVTEHGLNSSISNGSSEKNTSELEVSLRVKENELQYMKKELQCLREELQTWQRDKQFASEKYKDVYEELTHLKTRSEREIDHLREHLRLAMAALQEKQILGNSTVQ
ncbi:TRIO and F-actin-binding protein isoform X2 [Protopterus annectens]|uniref:TRIO and F-actin-binding protein isoform X2 n=1 Tax=Protopterus annectens TaxID=7888 RepID=UPI001CFAA4A8|nr:TRIO and F-actin-binding protein isoform X2 [Protopterus annectens]